MITISKEEKEFRVCGILNKYGYLSNDDDNLRPSPPVLLELFVDKEKQVGAAIAIDDHHLKEEEEEDQEEYSMKMKKSSEDKPPAIIDDGYQSNINKFEEPMGKQISLKFPPKKRLLSEYYQEEGEAAKHNNKKKIKNEEISCCSASPPPELQRNFIISKNKAWGSSFMHYFAKENNFVEAEKLKKKKTTKIINARDSPVNQPPPLPQMHREKVNALGGSEPVLVIQKRLFKSDLTQQLNRFSIPLKQKRAEFLTDEEEEFVKNNQLEVTLIDPRSVEWKLNMKEWNMNSSVYVLMTNWYKLVVENADLTEGTEVQLWSFRRKFRERITYALDRIDNYDKPSTDSTVSRKFLPYTLVIKKGQIFTRPKNLHPTGSLVSDEQRQLIIPLEKNEALPHKKRPFFQTENNNNNNNNNNRRRRKIIKKTSGKAALVHNPPPPLELPQDFKEKIAKLRGSKPVLIIEKRLFKSDVNKQRNRFSFPVKQVKSEFLTLEEKTFLDSPNQEIGVRVIDPGLREWTTIDLNKWDINKSFNYVLVSKWNELISKNGLKEGTVVQLWSFRVDDHLWFALVKPRPKE
ncbi:hypothetical protein LguiA_036574 [Lonicera macranthoides]